MSSPPISGAPRFDQRISSRSDRDCKIEDTDRSVEEQKDFAPEGGRCDVTESYGLDGSDSEVQSVLKGDLGD